MGNVGRRIFEDNGFQGVPVGERIFDAKPATPAMAEEMDPAQLQRLANRFGFFDIARDGPEFLIRRAV